MIPYQGTLLGTGTSVPGYSNSFMPQSDYAKKLNAQLLKQNTPPAPAPQSILPEDLMTQRGNSLFGSGGRFMARGQNTGFTDKNPSYSDREFNLANFQNARPKFNFSQGDTAFGETANMIPLMSPLFGQY